MFTNFPNGVTSFGIPQIGADIPATYGKVWFVNMNSGEGSDDNSGEKMDEASATLSNINTNKAITNNNDVILMSAFSELTEDSEIAISKSRLHIIGLDGGGRRAQQGTRIALNATGIAAAVESTINNTGTRNHFANLKISNAGTDAASVAGMIDAGEGTHIESCSIMKFSDLAVAAVADFICRADSPRYRNVEFGFDTLLQAAARATFWIKNSGGTRAKHIDAVGCKFVCASSASTKSHILIANTSSLAFSNDFEECIFKNALVSSMSAAALADAVTSVSGLVEGDILFTNPKSNALEFCSAVTDQIKVVGPSMATFSGADPAVVAAQTIGIGLTPA